MDETRLLNVLSNIPRDILLHCAEQLLQQKIKNKNTLITEVKNKTKLEPILKKMSSGSKNVMLAHVYDPDKHAKKVAGWWMSIKYDGVRAKWNGEEMESRTGKIYTLPDFLTEQLKKITDEDGNPMELDGELWGGNDTFALMSGLARRYENNPDDWNQVTYMIFDTPDSDIPLFEDRVKKVADAIKRAGSIPNIKGVKHKKYDPVTMNIQDELTKVEENGGEGLVLRKPKSSYVFTRSQDMLKVKSWSYKEAIVIGYVEGTGKYTGMVGSLSVKSDDFGEDEDDNTEKKWVNFKVGSGLSNWKTKEVQNKIDEARKQMVKKINRTSDTYKNLVDTIKTTIGKERSDALHQMNEIYTQMPLIGDVITFRFKELTKDGNPSMGTFVGVRDYE
jgi:DNA ligase-1